MDLPTIVTMIKDILTGLAAVTAAVVAILGLRTWQNELKGKAEYDLARRLLLAVYKVREAFKSAMMMVNSPRELNDVAEVVKNKNFGNSDKVMYSAFVSEIYLRQSRIVEDAIFELNTMTLEAEAILGKDAVGNLHLLVECETALHDAYMNHITLRNKSTDNVLTGYGDYYKAAEHWIRTAYQPFFFDIVQFEVQRAERFLKPYLMAKASKRREWFWDRWAKG